MFLQQISNELISKHGNNLAKIAVVFPNKRASLWMNDYLLSAAEGKPVFAPQYFSISEFFQKHSEYILADHIQLVSLLHKSYCKITGEQQTLDSFYAWGEILLSDFDNADKSLADPKQLFQNISSLHEMDSIDYLTDEQKQLLEHFFKSFTRNHESIIQQKFISLWNNLLAIYNDFKATLHELGIAYEGMLYRDVVEKAKYEDFDYIHYYAIGFNQLLKCEQKLFLILADKITQKHDDASILTVNKEAKITIAQALTDDLQTRYIEQWLQEKDRISAGRRTAIILCNENLLPSAIYGLPENVGAVNITAGFPLAETQPASYISTLLELCTEGLTKDGKRFRTSYLRNLEGHPLHKFATKDIDASAVRNSTCKILEQMEAAIISIACNIQSSEVNNQLALLQEATFRVYNIITRLKSLYEEGSLEIEPLTLANLYKQIIQTTTIPFHGEPAVGIQIMGVLETRNLDFDHILMLSCNEGQMPQGGSDASAIPYNIKKAFELSTNDDRTNIFAYYFYRLLKRCKDVTLVYNASGSETSPGEMSRFLLNLIVNNAAQISRIALQTKFFSLTKQPTPQEISKEELRSYIEKIKGFFLSPSALNTYMRCEKKFYYKYYKGLKENNEEEDSMDAAAFGTFFHNTAEDFYRQFIGENITASLLQQFVDKKELLNPHVNRALEKTINELYNGGNNIDSGGMEHLLKSIVREYMVRVIKNDIKFCPFTIVNLEKKYKKTYTVNTSEGEIAFEIGGAVDRLDKITDEQGKQILRVVDYKTGKDHGSTKINDIEEMFDDSKEGSDYFRQTSLYSIAIAEDRLVNPQHLAVAPSLYYIRNKDVGNNDATYNPIISYAGQPLSDIENIKADYEEELHKVLHSIFNKTTFDIPADLSICNNCPFAELCQD